MPKTNWILRPARTADLPMLAAIEQAADEMFRAAGIAIPDEEYAEDSYDDTAGTIIAALADTDAPIGFSYVVEMEQGPHLAALAVHPDYGRQGIGAALVQDVLARAEAAHSFAVTLSTFISVPWNGPFYEAQGFEAVSPLSLGVDYPKLRQAEADMGLDVSQRQFMIRYLNPVSRNEPAST